MTDQEVQLFLADLAIVILLARLLGMAAKQLGQRLVLGEITAASCCCDSRGNAHLTVRRPNDGEFVAVAVLSGASGRTTLLVSPATCSVRLLYAGCDERTLVRR